MIYGGESRGPYVSFENGCHVERRCPRCARYLRAASIRCWTNGLDETRTEGVCAVHGVVAPDWMYL